ncbi:glutathione S-transferase T1-like [Carica papaya]|uniref:glutathione S-transferase T1-like n=1 Tax=Carica papaya TaxID=3649 RepID=UPI000B8CBE27|nr:glutathione S-transferase T1-like [Carica papaya]
MKLKVYADRMSQPSRAVIIFCKVNGIDFEEIKVDISKGQQYSPEFRDINPMRNVPAIVDGKFKLFESHAILIYLACAFPGVADHWWAMAYFKIPLSVKYLLNTVLAPVFGLPLNPEAAAEGEELLSSSLYKIESIWLKGNGRFLLGGNQPSIADLSLACEIMQLEVLDEKDRARLLGPHKKVQQWVENTRNATRPHFDEVHNILFRAKERIQKQRSAEADSVSGRKTLLSKI